MSSQFSWVAFFDDQKFSSTVHRKRTFSGVYSNFRSFKPETYKRSLVSTLLYRTYMISLSFQSFHKEIENLKKMFSKNGYRWILPLFNKLCEKRSPIHTVPKKEQTMILPFLGSTSLQFGASKQVSPFASWKSSLKRTEDSYHASLSKIASQNLSGPASSTNILSATSVILDVLRDFS
jgi:hypothetical protein